MKTGSRIAAAMLLMMLVTAGPTDAEEPPSIRAYGDPWRETRPAIFGFGVGIDVGAYRYGDPTPAEQAHLEFINRARLDPQAEADRLLGGDLNEGITRPEDVISTEPKQPLTMNASLLDAARLHSADMIANDYFAHDSQDGRTPWDRMAAAGYDGLIAGAENIGFFASTAPLDEVDAVTGFHDGFVVDENIAGRGHRINIFEDDLKEVGVGAADGAFTYNGTDYDFAWMLTCDFGSRSGSGAFVLGVVYTDEVVSDGWYTAGEGEGGVAVIAVRASDAATASAVTASAGGYGLPLPPGRYTVRATLPGGAAASRSVDLSDRNAKIDFERSDFSDGSVCGMPGDVDGNGALELTDALLVLQSVAGIDSGPPLCVESAVGGRGRIGLPDALYVLRASVGSSQ